MFNYLSDVIYHPQKASLDIESLPEDFREFGEGLVFFVECVKETRVFANALSKGDLTFAPPSSDNELAAPLKALQSSLRHVAWQTQQVAKGDYKQTVEFMGEFANAFNIMVNQLERQRSDLIEAKKAAEAASESKSAFLATVSHEIRTPLNAILGLSTMELEKDLPPKTHINLEKIFSSGSNLLNIVNDILDISKIEAGGFEIVPGSYAVPNMVSDVVELNMVRLESKSIDFELEVDETIPIKLYGDELRVKQILNNLLSNAFKYTEKGRVVFETTWRREENEAILIFRVTDTGIGIKKEDVPKIFREYSQLNQRANRNIEGTGLGLSITKHLVDLMKGTFTVESEYGVGSCFSVELPQGIVSTISIGPSFTEGLRTFKFERNRRKRDRNLVRAHMPYGKVLIVDDVVTNLDVAKGLMMPYKLTIDCVMSGVEAVEKIRAISQSEDEPKYDIVFMDHMMPEMDGIEATRIIREEIGTPYAKSVPIVALTANALSGNEDMFLTKGFNAYLSKPIDIMVLDMLLNKWVRDIQSEESLRLAERRKIDKCKLSNAATIPRELIKIGLVGVDVEKGLEMYGGDETLLTIYRSFVTHTRQLLDILDNALMEIKDGACKQYSIIVHGLKGSSNGIYATEVAKLALKLEQAANANDISTIKANHEHFVSTTHALIQSLEEFLLKISKSNAESSGNGNGKERKSAPEPQILEKIKEAAKHFKTSLMENFMAEIEQYEYDSGSDLVAWLRQNVDELEYEAIVKRLEDSGQMSQRLSS
jgi:signal transduction histidine kinase/CheY-like chemotaxis protein